MPLPPAQRASMAVLGALLCCIGCNGTPGRVSSSALAPGMHGEERPSKARVADPNGPFTIAAPRLVARKPLLDVNGVPECGADQLSLFESRAEIHGLHHAVGFTLRNSGAACRLSGFPSITLLGEDGGVLGSIRIEKVSRSALRAYLVDPAQAREAAMPDAPSPRILLTGQDEAAFEVAWTSGPRCAEASRIAIAAPGALSSVEIARPLQVCEDQVLITAVSQPDAP